MADDVRVPAGWYPDPLGLPQLRWWDNHAWTEYTSDARQPMVAQETVTQQTRLTFADDEAAPVSEVVEGRTRRERRDAEAARATGSDGIRETVGPGTPLAESLLALEAPQAATQVPIPEVPTAQVPTAQATTASATTASTTTAESAPHEEELSPAAKFAEFVPTAPAAAPVFDLGGRFDDLVGAPASEPAPASATTASATTTESAAGAFFAQPAAAPVGAFSYDYPSVGGSAASAAAAAAATISAPPSEPRRKNTSTGPVWLIAVFPLLGLFTALVMLASKITDPTGLVIGLAALVVPYILGIPFAMADWSMLTKRGYRPAHWLWAMAGPAAYLFARAIVLIRASGRGYGPLLGSAAFAVLTLSVAIAVPGLVIGLNPAGYSASIEQSVEQQAKALGADIEVHCPPTPPTLVGDQVVCQATEKGDSPLTWGVTVSLERSNGWISWRVDDWGIFMVSNSTPKTSEG